MEIFGIQCPIIYISFYAKISALLHKQNQEEQAPSFTMDLTDIGVAIGHPVTLKCCFKGIPEPQLKVSYFVVTESNNSFRQLLHFL